MKIPLFLCMALLGAGPALSYEVVSLRLAPGNVKLWGNSSSQQILVLAQCSDGLERDVTDTARMTISPTAVGEINQSGLFIAKSNGESRLKAQHGGKSASTNIRVEGVGENRPFSFASNIGGILIKRGCNDSECHGGVKGKGGLKLSVSAQFPRDDYKWLVEGGTFQVLTTETGAKVPRVNLAEPEKSLLLQKATFQVAHGGGERFKIGSPDYESLLKWIREGAPYGEDSASGKLSIERVEVFPKEVVLDPAGRHQLLVTAHYSNGHTEDITGSVLYVSNNPSVAVVDENGMVRPKQTGETAVLIRAAGHAVSASVGVIQKPVANYPAIEVRNLVDRDVFAKLRRFNIVPSELSSDGEFLRRVCLDITGTLPPPERAREFLSDKNPRKREILIERLLDSPEYVDFWSYRLGDLLRVQYNTLQDRKATKAFEDWLINSVASNKPYDRIARERIAGQGFSAPSRNFYYITEILKPEIVMPELVRVFWGRRIECAQCHNHPFESWSQNQFWNLSAFFAGVTELRESRVVIDTLAGNPDQSGDMMPIHPRTKAKVVPAFLDGTELPKEHWRDPRQKLAEWVTAQPYFAEAAVNRVWGYFFGRGIVEPVDDFRSTNPPSNPDLLRALADDFRQSGYDLKHLMRTLARSRAYQSSSIPVAENRDDRMNFSHAQARPLEAAVLLDAISSATGVPEEFRYHPAAGGQPPPHARALQLLPEFTPSQFLDAYGRSMRTGLPGGPPQPNLSQALHMYAGSTYNTKILREGGRLDRLMKRGASDGEIIDEFYMAALTRLPDAEEKQDLLRHLGEREKRRPEALARLVWAIVSSREFATNH